MTILVVPYPAPQVPAQPFESCTNHPLLRESECRDARPHLVIQVYPRPPPAHRRELVLQIVGKPEVGDLHAASRCLLYEHHHLFERWERLMRLVPELREVVLEPE